MLTLSKRYLQLESEAHRGTGGASEGNKALGFRPGFLDTHTGISYEARFADGRAAPFHLLDGIPDELVVARDRRGNVSQVVGTIVAGFLRGGFFYTREEAAKAVADAELEFAACG
jgi:hypothetical protein